MVFSELMSGVGKDLIRRPYLNEVTEVKIGGPFEIPWLPAALHG